MDQINKYKESTESSWFSYDHHHINIFISHIMVDRFITNNLS